MIVTVDEVKTHLRIQHDEEDDYIAGLIAQAQTAAEDYCRVSFEPEPDEEGNVPEVPQPVRLAVILISTLGVYGFSHNYLGLKASIAKGVSG